MANGKKVTNSLKSLIPVMRKDSHGFFWSVGKHGAETGQLKDPESVVTYYLTHHYDAKQGTILVYTDTCVDPVREGEWANPSRVFHDELNLYQVTREQFVFLDIHADTIRCFTVPLKVKTFKDFKKKQEPILEVERSYVQQRWIEQLSPQDKQKYLDKLLLKSFLKNPRAFL